MSAPSRRFLRALRRRRVRGASPGDGTGRRLDRSRIDARHDRTASDRAHRYVDRPRLHQRRRRALRAEGYGHSGELVGSADAALYAAKADGRNRVVGAHTLAPGNVDARSVLGNIPSRATRFVGHHEEVTRLSDAVERTPVVTITGAGGVGKTRIAIEVARRLARFFSDGTWFLDLAMLDDPADFMPFACEVMRTVAPLARDGESLASALGDKRLLIVMDNCEHVIPQAAELARMLAVSAPKVRVIATSREPLHVKGGTTHRLGSLPLEDAVELFTERARAGGIWLGDERRAIIAAIVQQLDSIPLAIELAAPQLRSMSPEELLRRLDDRLQVLGSRIAARQAGSRRSKRCSTGAIACSTKTAANCSGGWRCSPAAARWKPPCTCAVTRSGSTRPSWAKRWPISFRNRSSPKKRRPRTALPHARDHPHLRAGVAGRVGRVRRGGVRARSFLHDARAAVRRHARSDAGDAWRSLVSIDGKFPRRALLGYRRRRRR